MNPAPNRSIVLVDDEKSYTDLMSQMLEETLGCRVAAFNRPLEALSAVAIVNPAVIVTDYHMPQIDGLKFVRLAAALAPSATFVLISGHNLDAVLDDIAQLRVIRGVLSKPFGWRKLADEIVRVWPQHLASPTAHRADATSL